MLMSTIQLRRIYPNLFQEFFSDLENLSGSSVSLPKTDLAENEDSYELFVEVPGIDEKELDIEVKKNTLTISGEKKASTETENFRRRERSHGKFSRSFTLPDEVNLDEIEAKYSFGVLNIKVPKAPESQPKKIRLLEQ